MKQSSKRKRVSWARGSNLCQVKFFKTEDCPSEVGTKPNEFDDFPPGFEGVFQNQQRCALRADWKVAAGEGSEEKRTQMLREKRVLAGDYRHISATTPRSLISFGVEKETYDDNLTPLIPNEKTEESRKDIDPLVEIKELLASGADVETAAAIAAAIVENNMQGRLINLSLLPEIVSDPTFIDKIIEAYNNNVMTVRSPKVEPIKTAPPTSSRGILSTLATTTATAVIPLSRPLPSISPTMALPSTSVIVHGENATQVESTIPRIVKTTPPTSSLGLTATSFIPLSRPLASISSTMAVPSPSVIMHGEKAKQEGTTIPRIVKTTPPTSSIGLFSTVATTTATSFIPLSRPLASISSTMEVPSTSLIMQGENAKQGGSTIPRIVKTTPPTGSIGLFSALATKTATSFIPLPRPLAWPLAPISSTMAVPSPSVIIHDVKAKQVGSTIPRIVQTPPPTSSIGLLSTLATSFIPLPSPLAWPLAPISSTMAVPSPSVIIHGEKAKQVGSTIPGIVKTTPPTRSIELFSTLATTSAASFIPLSRPLASSSSIMAVPSPSAIMLGENAKQVGSTIPRTVKDPNYYKQLIKKHGTDRRELQICQNNLQDLKRPCNIIKPGGLNFKIQKPCKYFRSSTGCCHGSDCLYQHIAQSEVDNAAKHDKIFRM